MNLAMLAERLWGQKARVSYLAFAAIFLLFTLLGAREIWTQEHRWADIVAGMFYRQDFLHPYLGNNYYYDKPLLSYWLVALIAKFIGDLNIWALRLPSTLAGLLAIFSVYRLGCILKNREFGLLSGWLLLTTYYFVFWARISSADMLNLAGSLCAITWYFSKRKQAHFFDYAIFFLIIALTCLCKGLIGAIVPLIAVIVDMSLQKSWKQHLRITLFLALIPAFLIYLLPFIASSIFNPDQYHANGLYLVYRENILRYFEPFDHRGPIYTYFIYLPLYTFPWAIFLIPAFATLPARWKNLTTDSKWIVITTIVLFIFLTISGSRRSYYVLPLVPFAILMTADWLMTSAWHKITAFTILFTFILLFLAVSIIPAWYYANYGIKRFAHALQIESTKIQPWQQWQVIMLDGETKLNFYLHLSPQTKNYSLPKSSLHEYSSAQLLAAWPILANKPTNTIFITRKAYAQALQPFFAGYQKIEMTNQNDNMPIAFVPAS